MMTLSINYSLLGFSLLLHSFTGECPVPSIFCCSHRDRDTPLNLVFEYGGFLNGSVVEDFDFYARTCFERFGDRVSLWFTFKYVSSERLTVSHLSSEPRVYGSQYQG